MSEEINRRPNTIDEHNADVQEVLGWATEQTSLFPELEVPKALPVDVAAIAAGGRGPREERPTSEQAQDQGHTPPNTQRLSEIRRESRRQRNLGRIATARAELEAGKKRGEAKREERLNRWM